MSERQPWLVAGLGNPGPAYAGHRHNAGFLVVDYLAAEAGVRFTAPRGMRADVAETRASESGFGGLGAAAARAILVKPRTYMNESGVAVGKIAAFYKVPPAQIIAVHDELDLDLGQLRLKIGGGDNGHNGLRSLRSHLRTGDFCRVRFGIGRPPGRMEVHDYVLTDFARAERIDVELEVARAADAVTALIVDGLPAAQNRFNS